MENNQGKKNIYQERERYRQKAFLMILETVTIIALPAIVALFIGKYLDKNNQNSDIYTNLLLVVSFILSWAIIISKYIKFDRKVKEVDRKIRELKEKENVDNTNSGK